MDESDNVRWTISVPKETDVALRTYLAQMGLKKGTLSAFVVDAVRWRLFDLNLSAAREKNADVPAEEIEDATEQALTDVRAGASGNPADAGDR